MVIKHLFASYHHKIQKKVKMPYKKVSFTNVRPLILTYNICSSLRVALNLGSSNFYHFFLANQTIELIKHSNFYLKFRSRFGFDMRPRVLLFLK